LLFPHFSLEIKAKTTKMVLFKDAIFLIKGFCFIVTALTVTKYLLIVVYEDIEHVRN